VIRLLAEWNGNVKDAVLNGEKGRAWRKENLPIPRAEVLPTLKTGKFVFAGYDKVGRAICYYRVKFHNPRQFAPLQSVKAVVYLYEEMRAEGRLRGAEEICVVVDRTDAKSANMDIEVRTVGEVESKTAERSMLSLRRHFHVFFVLTHSQFMKLLYTMLKESYPARGELFLVLGVNFIFRKIWENLVSVFLDAKSRSATHLLKDKKELLDFIEEGELVEWLGGKLPYTFVPPLDE